MIKIELSFNSVAEAQAVLAKLPGATSQAAAPAPPAPPAAAAPAPPAPPAAAAPAPPAAPEPVSPEQLQTAMQEKSATLGDGGTACFNIIRGMGVAGISAMTDQQRVEAMQKVKAL